MVIRVSSRYEKTIYHEHDSILSSQVLALDSHSAQVLQSKIEDSCCEYRSLEVKSLRQLWRSVIFHLH